MIPSYDAASLAAVARQPELIAAIRAAFAADHQVPQRAHFDIPAPGGDGTLLIMPAWSEGASIGIKIATVFPGNSRRGLATVGATYLLLSATTGEPRALLDGKYLTACRTAAVSGAASSYLSRDDSKTLLLVGTGNLIPHLLDAHRAVRDIDNVLVWGRDAAKAGRTARAMQRDGLSIEPVGDLQAACGRADIISCATLSTEPLVKGAWVPPGTHVDLVGSFKPSMREADDALLQRACIFADDRAAALAEAGEFVTALRTGALLPTAILGDLRDLARGTARGRINRREVTVFKSVGTARSDLAAATLLVGRLG